MADSIRTFGDPVLKTKAQPVADVDGKARRLVDKMFGALYGTDNGLALAAPQIGVQKQVVVWDSTISGLNTVLGSSPKSQTTTCFCTPICGAARARPLSVP